MKISAESSGLITTPRDYIYNSGLVIDTTNGVETTLEMYGPVSNMLIDVSMAWVTGMWTDAYGDDNDTDEFLAITWNGAYHPNWWNIFNDDDIDRQCSRGLLMKDKSGTWRSQAGTPVYFGNCERLALSYGTNVTGSILADMTVCTQFSGTVDSADNTSVLPFI